VLEELYSTPTSGHSSFHKTYSFGKAWNNLDIHDFIVTCDTFQRNQGEIVKMLGVLQPLPIPTHMWTKIYIDFIEGHPRVGNKSMMMVVINRISKYAHLCTLSHPFIPSLVAQIFMDHILKLHGMATSIFLDWDPTFTMKFWYYFFNFKVPSWTWELCIIPKQMVKLSWSKSDYKPLWFFSFENPHQWAQWILLAEWWYNTSYHGATKTTPYEVLYGKTPCQWILIYHAPPNFRHWILHLTLEKPFFTNLSTTWFNGSK